MKEISSTQNSYIKELSKLQIKSRERTKTGLFIAEGKREVSLAITGGYITDSILFNPDIIAIDEVLEIVKSLPSNTIEITKEVYQKLAYRDTSEGIIAVFKSRELNLTNIKFKNKYPLVLVAEAPEKPGNIGALLRTADAANVDAVLIANPKTDLYNPNIIRSSVGCLFTNQIGIGTSSEIIAFLKEHKIDVYATTLQNSNSYIEKDFTKASAIVVGTESTGLTQEWRDAGQNINIPMQGKIDSMNVSVAAAIIIFEAKRQRGLLIAK